MSCMFVGDWLFVLPNFNCSGIGTRPSPRLSTEPPLSCQLPPFFQRIPRDAFSTAGQYPVGLNGDYGMYVQYLYGMWQPQRVFVRERDFHFLFPVGRNFTFICYEKAELSRLVVNTARNPEGLRTC